MERNIPFLYRGAANTPNYYYQAEEKVWVEGNKMTKAFYTKLNTWYIGIKPY